MLLGEFYIQRMLPADGWNVKQDFCTHLKCLDSLQSIM